MPHQLHSMDRLFLDLETDKTSMGITPLFFYDPAGMEGGEFSYPKIVAHIESCIKTIPALYGKLSRVNFDLDNPYIVNDPQFSMERHICHRQLNDPTDIKELSKLFNNFQRKGIDTTRPLWEAMVISGVNIRTLPKDCFIIALKIHHAVADGMTTIKLTGMLHGLTPIGEEVVLPSEQSLKKSGLFGSATRIITNNIKQSIKSIDPLLKVAPRVGLNALNTYYDALTKKSEKIAKTRFDGDICDERVWGYSNYSMNDLKKIRSVFPSATINDIVICIVAGALREYLIDKNEEPLHTIQAFAPINVRRKDEENQAGNQVTASTMNVPAHIEDPLKRLISITKSTTKTKEHLEKMGSRNMADLTKAIPPAYLSLLFGVLSPKTMNKMVGSPGSIVISNMIGPATELNMLGAKLVTLAGAGIIDDGVGIFHPVSSYNGTLTISVTSCPSMIPDIKFYIDCLDSSFNKLLSSFEQRIEQIAETANQEKEIKKQANEKKKVKTKKATTKAAAVEK